MLRCFKGVWITTCSVRQGWDVLRPLLHVVIWLAEHVHMLINRPAYRPLRSCEQTVPILPLRRYLPWLEFSYRTTPPFHCLPEALSTVYREERWDPTTALYRQHGGLYPPNPAASSGDTWSAEVFLIPRLSIQRKHKNNSPITLHVSVPSPRRRRRSPSWSRTRRRRERAHSRPRLEGQAREVVARPSSASQAPGSYEQRCEQRCGDVELSRPRAKPSLQMVGSGAAGLGWEALQLRRLGVAG